MNLQTPKKSVQTLQKALQTKAKAEPGFRFYSLWDKVFREDVLRDAWRRSRSNGGSPGVDGDSFEAIESRGVEAWLGNLQEELKTGTYQAQPLLRVWIPKPNGKLRPLSIPTIRDRVVQTACVLVMTPVFESDLPEEQHGFREERSAKTALREVHLQVSRRGRTEVVDADLASYFETIPHGRLLRCLSRRVSDGRLLGVIKQWLIAPVIERSKGREMKQAQARRTSRGTPQGGALSPLLANLYFRRFVLAWRRTRCFLEDGSTVVNYADDFVICCKPGAARRAADTMRNIIRRLGLQVNDDKTKIVSLPEESLDFLGYSIKKLYRRTNGTAYIGTVPSMKARKRLISSLRAQTSTRYTQTDLKEKVSHLNRLLRGWCNYFDLGPVWPVYSYVMRYTRGRLRRWLQRKHKRKGAGYRQYSDECLHGEIGLYQPRPPAWGSPRAKV